MFTTSRHSGQLRMWRAYRNRQSGSCCNGDGRGTCTSSTVLRGTGQLLQSVVWEEVVLLRRIQAEGVTRVCSRIP